MEKEPKPKPAEKAEFPEVKPEAGKAGDLSPGYGEEAIAANCIYGMFENPLDGAEE